MSNTVCNFLFLFAIFCLIIHFMTSACDLVYWYILMIRRFLVIKHLKREKRYDLCMVLRSKSKWHAYDINQDAEHKPIIHFCLIWFGQFLLFLQIYKRRCAKRCVWFISRYPSIAIWTTHLCFFSFLCIYLWKSVNIVNIIQRLINA